MENKEKLIDDLMFSDASAKDIVTQHAEVKAIEAEMEAAAAGPKFSTGMRPRTGFFLTFSQLL